MKYLNTIGALAAAMLLLPSQTLAAVRYKGFDMKANTANGDCKSEADWETDFKTIKGWGKGFNAVRIPASSDCGGKTSCS
jgi:exo-beta-1,3-glucanase (GH17 family)